MQVLNTEQRTRWNFDFATMTPLADGDWEWEKVTHPSLIPQPTPTSAKNPASFAPMSPLAAQQASFRLPDVPLAGAKRPPSISDDPASDADRLVDEGDLDDAEDVFMETTALSDPPRKRARLDSDANDENANPAYSIPIGVPTDLPRVDSPLFTRGSMGRSMSESSDSDADSIAPQSPSASTITSSTALTTTTLTKAVFKDPCTPSRATLGDLASPPRVTRALSRKRDSASGASAKSGSASQTRLQQYFAVKRRGSEALGGSVVGGGAATERLSHLRKRIDFDA